MTRVKRMFHWGLALLFGYIEKPAEPPPTPSTIVEARAALHRASTAAEEVERQKREARRTTAQFRLISARDFFSDAISESMHGKPNS